MGSIHGNFYLGAIKNNGAGLSKKGMWLTYKTDTYQIATLNGKCLDVSRGNTNRGTRLLWWKCHKGKNQKWIIPGFMRASKYAIKVNDRKSVKKATKKNIKDTIFNNAKKVVKKAAKLAK